MRALAAAGVAGLLVEAEGWMAGVAGELYGSPGPSGIVGAMLAAPFAVLIGLLAAWSVRRRPVPRPAAKALLLGGSLVAGLGLLAPQSKFVPYPYIDTCFAPGFDRERFSEVRSGMSPAEVEALLGRPKRLRDPSWGYILAGSPDQIWAYSGDHCSPFGTTRGGPMKLAFAAAGWLRRRRRGGTTEVAWHLFGYCAASSTTQECGL